MACCFDSMEYGTRVRFLRGAHCKECGHHQYPQITGVYVGDTLSNDGVFSHAFEPEHHLTCTNCGHETDMVFIPCGWKTQRMVEIVTEQEVN